MIQAVLDARDRVMLEMNIPVDKFDQLVGELPCMRAPTVAPLYNDEGYAVKIAVKAKESAKLISRLKTLGATDILEYRITKVLI
jgi:ATP phosphoribosyltransferase